MFKFIINAKDSVSSNIDLGMYCPQVQGLGLGKGKLFKQDQMYVVISRFIAYQ